MNWKKIWLTFKKYDCSLIEDVSSLIYVLLSRNFNYFKQCSWHLLEASRVPQCHNFFTQNLRKQTLSTSFITFKVIAHSFHHKNSFWHFENLNFPLQSFSIARLISLHLPSSSNVSLPQRVSRQFKQFTVSIGAVIPIGKPVRKQKKLIV